MCVSLLIAAGAYYFFLDEKVTKTDRRELMNTYQNKQQVNKSRQKKASPHRPLPLARFSVWPPLVYYHLCPYKPNSTKKCGLA
jgi:hypothetical protein